MALSVTSVKDLGFTRQFKLSDGRVVRESDLAGLGLATPPAPAPLDTDVFIEPALGRSSATNFILSTEELKRKVNVENRNQTNSESNIGQSSVSSRQDSQQPEPAASAQNPRLTNPASNFEEPGATPDNVLGSGVAVAKMTAGQNVITANGTARNSKSRDGGGLSPNFESISIDPRPNQLSDYASHTYNIALYMLQPANYVKLLKNPSSVAQIPKQLIMRSGGVGFDGGDNFDVDFFIDNLQMTNLGISPNTRTTNTNAVKISFEITEPMGVTLIERLKNEAKNSLGEGENYTNTPYLLEITFKGYNDSGEEIIGAIKPKYIPIKLTNITFRVESTGTVYKIRAIPFHQDVLGSLSSTIPINIQVSAGTVNDIFGGTAQQFKHETEILGDEFGSAEFQGIKTPLGDPSADLSKAINDYFESQTKETTDKDGKKIASSTDIADKWSFEIAPEIKNAKLVGSKFDALNTPQKNNEVYKQAASKLRGQVNLDPTTNLFRINGATDVVALINYIVVASDYVDENIDAANGIANNSQQSSSNVAIKWFKIIPQIQESLGWDHKAGRYKFHIKWTIAVHGMYYSDFPWAPKTTPKGQGVHKVYDYIFSGLNTEITDLILQFDNAFYNANTIGTGIPADNPKDKSTWAPKTKFINQSKQGQGIINDTTVTKKRSKDLMSNLMYDGYDLIQLDVAILGDPAFLPIGDAFFQPQGNRDAIFVEPFLPDDTINYDLTPPYVQINLKTPSDYDELTGLVDLSGQGKYTSSEFSGVYRLTSSESTFSGGMFTQRLYGFREKMQPINGRVGRSLESIELIDRRDKQVGDLTETLFSLLFGKDPLGTLISKGSAVLSTIGESAVTGFQANRIQRLADESDQGQFAEGIGDEDDTFSQIQDNGRIIDISEVSTIFEE
tara:strand:+ start:128 stop:2833 length:2706 start_codon:yes stop_codon:yes gene_type:complete